ncbi:MAG: O-antigen/teichoic acid export membrane protein [Sediminicola sp.]|jgi:O-antigen/teichoic acid export membrane protein
MIKLLFLKDSIKKQNLINLALRGLSIGGRFLLVIFISKELSVSSLGVFGLFNTTVLLAVQFVGFDFYVFNTREIIRAESRNRFNLIFNQFFLHLATYLLILPLILPFIEGNLFKGNFLIYLIVILILEHLGNEVYRLLICLQNSILASIVLFLRTSAWVFILLIISFYKDVNLELIFLLWIIGAFFSIIVGGFKIYKLPKPTHAYKININWIKKGLLVSLPFFISTILMKITEFSNRYFLDYYFSKEDVGIFTFFVNFSNILSVVVYTLVVMTELPALIESHKNVKTYVKLKNQFKRKITNYSFIFTPLVFVVIFPVILILDQVIYLDYIASYIILLATNLIICLTYVTHNFLYVENQDKNILISYLIGMIINVTANVILIPNFGVIGASISSLLGFLVIYLIQLNKIRRNA